MKKIKQILIFAICFILAPKLILITFLGLKIVLPGTFLAIINWLQLPLAALKFFNTVEEWVWRLVWLVSRYV